MNVGYTRTLERLDALEARGPQMGQALIGPIGFQRNNFGNLDTEGQFGYLHDGNRAPYIVPYDARLSVISGAIEDTTRKMAQQDISGSFHLDVYVNGAVVYRVDHPGPASVFHHPVAGDITVQAGDELSIKGAPRAIRPTTAEIGVSVHMECTSGL